MVGLGKYAGWNTSSAENEVKARAHVVRHEATAATDYLKGLLPSTWPARWERFLASDGKANPSRQRAGPGTSMTTTTSLLQVIVPQALLLPFV